MMKASSSTPRYTGRLWCCRKNHQGNSATSEPTVPGARGDKPMPKPLAIQPAGWVSTMRAGCGALNSVSPRSAGNRWRRRSNSSPSGVCRRRPGSLVMRPITVADGFAGRHGLLDCQRMGRRGGEAQFVVVAAAELQAPARPRRRESARQACAKSASGPGPVRRPTPLRAKHMAQVGEQPIADVDGGAGEAAQCDAGGDARRRPIQAVAQLGRHQRLAAPLAESACRIADGAGDPDIVIEAGAIATQRRSRRNQTMRGDRDRQRAARGVAADQRHADARRPARRSHRGTRRASPHPTPAWSAPA